ncbi:MAG: UvrD-helicase domain-containing protein [Phycisphaerales bacterium]
MKKDDPSRSLFDQDETLHDISVSKEDVSVSKESTAPQTVSALHKASPHTIVRASAGSGKTYQLTNRYIEKLIQGEDPSTILATTFTRAAAGEILHRVLLRLSQSITEPQKLTDLQTALKQPNLSASQCEKVLSTLVDQLHRLSILTMDSFFSRLASSFTFELGLPLSYRMLEDDEELELKELSIDQTLNQCSLQELIVILRSMQGDKILTQAHQSILKAVNSTYPIYLATESYPQAWEAITPAGAQIHNEQLPDILQRIQKSPVAVSKSTGKPNGHWINAVKKLITQSQSGQWEDICDGKFANQIIKHLDDGQSPEYQGFHYDPALITAMTPLVNHARWEITNTHCQRTKATHMLMQRFDEAFKTLKLSSSQLGYDDPPRLLSAANITGDLEHIYYRLDSQIRHILLDEFQDTSMQQFKLFEPILDELLSQDLDHRSVFVVGDIKQSLYSWRQAEPTLLTEMNQRWDTLKPESLTKSYRSSPIILDSVNSVFQDLQNNIALTKPPSDSSPKDTNPKDMSQVGSRVADQWAKHFDRHQAANELPGEFTLRAAQCDEQLTKPTSSQSAEDVLWECANMVKEVQSKAPAASIAVLVRQTKHIYPMLSKLNALGIDACEDRGNPLVDSTAVAASVSMLELIDHPHNSAALHHVRSTPLGHALRLQSHDSIHAVASSLRREITEHGCASTVLNWFKLTAHSMDTHNTQRFKQFIDLAGKLDDEGNRSPQRLASIAQSRKIEAQGTAPVRVITIHRSKGLEFDAVVMPLMETLWKLHADSVLTKRDNPLSKITEASLYPSKILQSVHPKLQQLYDSAKFKQINEELCCLYVAMTRAKHCLHMVVPCDEPGLQSEPLDEGKFKNSPAHIMRAAFAPESPCIPGEILYQQISEQDWTDDQHIATVQEYQDDRESIKVKLQVRMPKVRRSAQLVSIAPSALSKNKTQSVSEILTPELNNQDAQTFGQSVHAAFEHIDWIDNQIPPDSELEHKLLKDGFDHNTITNTIKHIKSALRSDDIHQLHTHKHWMNTNPALDKANLYHERPFAVRIHDGNEERFVQGRFDRIVLGYKGDQLINAHIIDYKTDRIAPNGHDQQSASELHKPQMDLYRQAACTMFGLDESMVNITLVFTARLLVVDMLC